MNTNDKDMLDFAVDDLADIIGELNITASFCGLVARSLPNHGLRVEEIFPEVGLAIPAANNPVERISFEQFSALLEHIAIKSGDPAIGVKIFAGLKAADLSALGFALFCSATLLSGFERLQRSMPFLISSGDFDIIDEEEQILMVIAAPRNSIAQTNSYVRVLECFLTGIVSVIREISDSDTGFSQIFLRRCSDPLVVSYLEGVSQCEIIVGAPFDGVRISRESAVAMLPSANPEMALLNDKLLSEQLNKIFTSNIVYRVEKLVVEGLETGRFAKADIARKLAMSERSLHRNLERKGATFGDIVNRVRRNLAMQYVKSGELRINQVAYKLGFASASNFSRSFKQWTGCSPREFREL